MTKPGHRLMRHWPIATLLAIASALYLNVFLADYPTFPVEPWVHGESERGGDYWDFYVAGRALNLGAGPIIYTDPRYNKPPLVAQINRVLSHLPYGAARITWQLALIASLVATLVLVGREFGAKVPLILAVIGGTLTSYPFQLQIDRGNLDPITYFLAFCAVIASKTERPLLAGVLFGLGLNLKPNILVLAAAFPLTQSVRHVARVVASCLAVTSLVAALDPQLMLTFLDVLRDRAAHQVYHPSQHVSFARFLLPFGTSDLRIGNALVMMLLAFIVGGSYRWRRALRPFGTLHLMIALLPFCAAYPPATYMYTLCILPAVWFLWSHAPNRVIRWIAGLGLVLTQLPIHSLLMWVPEDAWLMSMISWLPSLGIVLLCALGAAYVWLNPQEMLSVSLEDAPPAS